MEIRFFDSGFCTAHARIVNPVSGRGKSRFHAIWALIQLEKEEYMLIDTGYSPRFHTETRHFPWKLYAWITPVFLSQSLSAKASIEKLGIESKHVKWIYLTHLHADHVCGLKDFPHATPLVSRACLLEFKQRKGISALSKGIVSGLFDSNFTERAILIEEIGEKGQAFGLEGYFLWGKKELMIVSLPGHARGMTGLLYRGDDKTLLYASDAAWDGEAFEMGILPSRITSLMIDSWRDYVESWALLKKFRDENPDIPVLFTHCKRTLDYLSQP